MIIIQRFTFVEGCTSLLIDIFKDKSFELNKKEIHSELLYRRIFEIERFREVIEYFTSRVREVREFNLLMILRKMCIIDGNPLPLVQEEIFKKLYQSKDFPTRYELHHTKDQELWIIDTFETDKITKRYSSKDFMDISEIIANTEERLFLLEQLTLEADLCYGRNEDCKRYFREIYPCNLLIRLMKNHEINIDLRGKFVRIFNYLYIDDPPHKLIKMTRAFKAYESSNVIIRKLFNRQLINHEYRANFINKSRLFE
jgi:hypothetical protein